MKLNRLYKYLLMGAITISMATSCSEDFLETSPTSLLEESKVIGAMQADLEKVQAYVTGAYFNFYCGGDYWASHDDFGIPAIKASTDLWGEDVAYTLDQNWFCYDYQLDNRLGSYRRCSSTWNQLYSVIDYTNTIITMLKPTEEGDEPEEAAAIMLGEAYSLRAYCYFWLINLWQHPYNVNPDALGVPLKLENDFYRPERVPVRDIYAQILEDIDLGYNYLEGKGFHNAKVGLSEYAAAAIYANILMFTGDYEDAAEYAKKAIEGGSLNSEADMLSGFNSLDMPEVIWGYNVNNETTGYYASFFSHFDSYTFGYAGMDYNKMISSDLYDKIADNDIRKQWFGLNEDYNLLGNSFEYEKNYGLEKYISNKYRDIYLTSGGSAGEFTSAIIYFRTAEMYYLAAEAYYLNEDETNAIAMLNEITSTRIPGYKCTLSGKALYNEICIQKRIEMWLEGCRALDMKRRGETINRTLSINHATDLEHFNALQYTGHDYRLIYHIPTKELENNSAITKEDDNE